MKREYTGGVGGTGARVLGIDVQELVHEGGFLGAAVVVDGAQGVALGACLGSIAHTGSRLGSSFLCRLLCTWWAPAWAPMLCTLGRIVAGDAGVVLADEGEGEDADGGDEGEEGRSVGGELGVGVQEEGEEDDGEEVGGGAAQGEGSGGALPGATRAFIGRLEVPGVEGEGGVDGGDAEELEDGTGADGHGKGESEVGDGGPGDEVGVGQGREPGGDAVDEWALFGFWVGAWPS